MSNRKLLGRARITVDGQFYDSLPGASLEVGGIRNVSRPFTHGIKFNQNLQPGRVLCSVPVTESTSILALSQLTEVDVTFESDAGTTYIIRNAVQMGAVTVADGDSGGVAPLEFSGDPAEEVVNG
jgi:hypothetical protein